MPIKAKSAKAKGRKLERWLEDRLNGIGVSARRQPGSGAFEAFPHDVEGVTECGIRILFECKQRKEIAWATGERWIGSADALVIRIDPEPFKPENEPRVYMKWSTFERLVNRQRKETPPCPVNQSNPIAPQTSARTSPTKRKIASRPWRTTS